MKYLCLLIVSFITLSTIFAGIIDVPDDYYSIQAEKHSNSTIYKKSQLKYPDSYYYFNGSKNSSAFGLGLGIIARRLFFGFEIAAIGPPPQESSDYDYYVPHGDYYKIDGQRTIINKNGFDIYLVLPIKKVMLYGGGGLYFQKTSDVYVSRVTGWHYIPRDTWKTHIYISNLYGLIICVDRAIIGLFKQDLRGVGVLCGYAF